MDTENEQDSGSLRIDTSSNSSLAETGKSEIAAGLAVNSKDDQELKISKDLVETESIEKDPTDNPNLDNHAVMDSTDTPSVKILGIKMKESEDKDGAPIGQSSEAALKEIEAGSTSGVETEMGEESTDMGSNKKGSGLTQSEEMTDDGTVQGEKDKQVSESATGCKMDYRSKDEGAAAGDSSDSSDTSSDSDESDAEKEKDKKAEDKEGQDSTSKQINKAFSTRDESPEAERRVKLNRYGLEDVRTKGELLPEELPPLEELTITVDETVEMKKVGTIKSIVGILVVIQTCENVPPLNDDTILFIEGHKVLGQVFEVFGPVQAPWYSVRFNKEENITNKELKVGIDVFCAPKEDTFTSYVFVNSLKQIKGSDASWEDNNEPPEKYIEYSDDEAERAAKAKKKKKKHHASNTEPSTDCLPQEGKRSRSNNPNDQSNYGGGRPGQQPGSYRPRNPFQGSYSGPNRPRHPGPNNPRHTHNPRNQRWGPPQGNRPGPPHASFGGQPRFQPQMDHNAGFQFGQNGPQQSAKGQFAQTGNQQHNSTGPSFQAGGGFGNPGQQSYGGNVGQGTSQPFGANDRTGLNQPFGNNFRPDMNQSFGSNVRPGVGQSYGGNVRPEANQTANCNSQGRLPTPQSMQMNQSCPPWQNNMPFRTDIPPPTFNLSNNQTGCNNQNQVGPNSAASQLPLNNKQGSQRNGNQLAGNMQSPAQVNSFNSYPQQSPANTQSFPQGPQSGQFGTGPYQPPPPPPTQQNNPPQTGGPNTNPMFQFGNNCTPQQPGSVNQFQNNFSGTNQNMFQGNSNQMPANSNQRHQPPFQTTGNFSKRAPVQFGNRMKIHGLNPGLQGNTQSRPAGVGYEKVQTGGSSVHPYRPEILQQQQQTQADTGGNNTQLNPAGPLQSRTGNYNMNNGATWTG